MTTVTQWFRAEQPVHIGLYQREYAFASRLSPNQIDPDYWDGSKWFICDELGNKICVSERWFPWRGLAAKPKSGISSK